MTEKSSKHATGKTLELRVQFLIKHPALLAAPSDRDDVDDAGREALNKIVAKCRKLEILGVHTPDAAARDGVRRAIGIARRRIAAGVPAA